MKLVDVVIPVHNQPLMVIRCVTSIREQERRQDILIMDDGSDEETQAALKNLDGITVYRNPISQGFVSSTNRLVKKSTAPYVLILNSDTEAFPHFVEHMAENLDDGAAVCGALLLYPQNHPYQQFRGRVQHAGVGFEQDGFPYHVFAQRHPDAPAVRTWRSINAVTGAAFMVRREIWDKIGGFDPKFSPGVFEDVSFCLSVKAIGQEVIYEPRAVSYHWEHASQSQAGNWFSGQAIQNNLGYLFMKHGQPPADDHLFHKVKGTLI